MCAAVGMCRLKMPTVGVLLEDKILRDVKARLADQLGYTHLVRQDKCAEGVYVCV